MIRVRLLGAPSVEDATGGRVEALLAQPKRFAVLAYLAVEAHQGPVTRDKVAALFWPELDQARARQALRQSLHVLRKELGEDAVASVGAEMLALSPNHLTSDVAALTDAAAASANEEVVRLHRGPFLDGFHVPDAPDFGDWADGVRTRLRGQVARAAESLADAAERAGDGPALVRWLQAQLTLAELDERPLRRLMSALEGQGNGAVAVATYDAYAARMRREFEMEPSDETVRKAERIRTALASSGVEPVARGATPFEFAAAPVVPAASPAPPAGAPGVVARASRRATLVLAAAVVLLVAISAVVARDRARPPDTPPSVAVLPFLDLSPGNDQQYLSDGLTEELITALSKVRGLKVTARTSSFLYREARQDIPRIARELRVTSVLEGSVRRDGDRLRITAQLIDAGTGFHVWSDSYDRELADLFIVQGEIARAIAGALRVELVGTAASAARPSSIRTAAYDAYLRGLFFWNRRDAEGLRKAIAQFQDAIRIDSTFAAAHAGLAGALQLAPTFEVATPQVAFPAALAAVNRALALDPESAEARASLGYIRLHWERDWTGAEAELRRAIAINPAYATAHQWLRIGFIAQGRFDEALDAALRARELDPLSISIQAAVGDTYFYAGRYAEAQTAYGAALDLDPTYERASTSIARAEFLQGRRAEGLALMERALAQPPRNPRYEAHLAVMYAELGRRDEAQRVVARLRGASRRGYVPPYAFAVAHAALGNADSVLYWRNRAIAERDNWAVYIDAMPELKRFTASR